MIFALCGCDCREGVAGKPVEVKVPVAIPCTLDLVMAPDWNIPKLAPEVSTTDRLKAALADLGLSRGYISGLRAELTACS